MNKVAEASSLEVNIIMFCDIYLLIKYYYDSKITNMI